MTWNAGPDRLSCRSINESLLTFLFCYYYYCLFFFCIRNRFCTAFVVVSNAILKTKQFKCLSHLPYFTAFELNYFNQMAPYYHKYHWVLKRNLFSCNLRVKQFWVITSIYVCCCVRLHFLNLYPLVDKISSWSTELQAVAKQRFKTRSCLVHFSVFSTTPLAEALHGCKANRSVLSSMQKSSKSSSP